MSPPLSSIKNMNHRYFVIILIFCSCSNRQVQLTQVPIVKGGFEHKQDESQYKEKVDFNKTKLYEFMTSANPKIENLYCLAKYEIQEMDSSKLRPFDLYLFESISKHNFNWHFLTLSRKNNDIIDMYDFNPDSLELRYVYQHSSDLDHDGIAIELIENKSTKDSILIYNNYLEVFETGKIELISKSASKSEVFKLLTMNQRHTGRYVIIKNKLKIDFKLKDGINSKNYSYKLNIFSPEGCIHTYLNLDYNISDNQIILDSLGDFTLDINDETILIKNNNFNSGCEDVFMLDYELIKTDDNKLR